MCLRERATTTVAEAERERVSERDRPDRERNRQRDRAKVYAGRNLSQAGGNQVFLHCVHNLLEDKSLTL